MLVKIDTNKFEPLNNSKELIYDKRLNWTTEQPTKPGHYWAWAEPNHVATMIKINENTLKWNGGSCYTFLLGYESSYPLKKWTHFVGPLAIPTIPIDCAVQVTEICETLNGLTVDCQGNRLT